MRSRLVTRSLFRVCAHSSPSSDEIASNTQYAFVVIENIIPKIYSLPFVSVPFPSPRKRYITAIIIIPLRFVKNRWEKNNNFSRQNNDPIIPFDLFYLFIYIYIFIPSIPLQWYIIPFNLPSIKHRTTSPT